ncbi:hypothetical protein LTR56_016839 [Elasticomyces elasticus]|nr:hypothetical protein LTR56_016839 [Elasticomyces elasticus]KAK3666675.1 hypothetical protein LTR22_002624 [Elasticomyces elasticus]KAK4921632.1 hypothetical protein LTR49_010918 [Elasticomyces elasticus]KAK5758576.1 hypothetical protein LTS12_011275 [Elasticomyces elasticus]
MADLCPFFVLPVELRLHIYSFAVLDDPSITIGTAELIGSHPDIVHRLYGGKRSPYPGIPEHHEPVVEAGFNASLLSATNPATIQLSQVAPLSDDESHEYAHTAHLALLLVNKQVNTELKSHFKISKNRQTSLFLAYPHGLHVCRTLTPHLLRQARSVHVAGTYVSRTFCPIRSACVGPREPAPALPKCNGGVTPNSTKQLADLIASAFGPGATHDVQKLELRTYYPGEDSYSTVWGDDDSPTVVALRNIYCGEVGIEVWRGRHGTGVYLTARHIGDGEKKRIVSTTWRRLEEGGRNGPKCGSWIVDPRWPEWDQGYTMSDGPKGDLIIHRPHHPAGRAPQVL